jgi:hypothetical protein
MDAAQIRQEIDQMLDQLPLEELVNVKGYVESLFPGGEGEEGGSGGAIAEDDSHKVTANHPAVINLANDLGLPPDEMLTRLGEYERDLLTTYIESGDTGMLIALRKSFGLPLFK